MNPTEKKITKYRAVLHLETGDITIYDVAVYPDDTIGFTEDALKKVLPEHHYIDWEDSCIRFHNPSKEDDNVNVCSILTGDDYIWIDNSKLFTLQKYTNKNDKYGVEIYEGDTCAFEFVKNFKNVLKNHFLVKRQDFDNFFQLLRFVPSERIVVCNEYQHLADIKHESVIDNFEIDIDLQIRKLSRIQSQISQTTISPADYNEISSRIGDLKEFMVNCDSYKKP